MISSLHWLLGEAGLFKHPAAEDYLTTNLPILALPLVERRLTTQEEAWALRLSAHLGSGEVSNETFGGLAWSAEDNLQVSTADFDGQKGIRNAGDAPLLVSCTAGAPADTSTVVSDGISIERVMLDMDTLQPVTNPAPGQRVLVRMLVRLLWMKGSITLSQICCLQALRSSKQACRLPSSLAAVGWATAKTAKTSLSPASARQKTASVPSRQALNTQRRGRTGFSLASKPKRKTASTTSCRTQAGHVTQPGAYGEAMYRPELRARAASRLIR